MPAGVGCADGEALGEPLRFVRHAVARRWPARHTRKGQDIHLDESGEITFRTKLELSFKYEHEH